MGESKRAVSSRDDSLPLFDCFYQEQCLSCKSVITVLGVIFYGLVLHISRAPSETKNRILAAEAHFPIDI